MTPSDYVSEPCAFDEELSADSEALDHAASAALREAQERMENPFIDEAW